MNKKVAMTGNSAAAAGAALCRPDLIAAYPITPQSSVVESLAEKVANGEIDSRMIQVESEHSAMSVVQGAAAAGGRVFTATSAQGLALMFEPYFRMSTLRMPMVMAIATREMTSPETVWSGHQDAIAVRDAGWIQIFCEDNQEIMDMIIQGYRLTEDPEILIPVNVCYDGFYLSHLVEGVEVPAQEQVDAFLPPVSFNHAVLDPSNPFALDPLTAGPILMQYRKSHLEAMGRVQEKLEQTDAEFARLLGRSHGGAVEAYRIEDAEVVLVTMGAATGTGREAVDMAREKGVRAGLLKIRLLRPFPAKAVAGALEGKKAFAVVDRNVCFGWNSGTVYMEVKAAMEHLDCAHFSVIGGLGGADLSLDHLNAVLDKLEREKNAPGEKDTVWLMD